MAGILTQIQEAEAKKRGLIPATPYVHQEYPKYVRLADGTKVLVQDEVEHAAAKPDDFEPKGKPGGKGKSDDK